MARHVAVRQERFVQVWRGWAVFGTSGPAGLVEAGEVRQGESCRGKARLGWAGEAGMTGMAWSGEARQARHGRLGPASTACPVAVGHGESRRGMAGEARFVKVGCGGFRRGRHGTAGFGMVWQGRARPGLAGKASLVESR
jgi:hypothetical protein